MFAIRARSVTGFMALLLFPLAALAGFAEALTAYQVRDYATAIDESRAAAAAGDARGSFLLGVMIQNGQGVAANSGEAAALYEKAVQGGVVGAFSKLAQLYARGDGVAKDLAKALALARRGAQAGDPEATFFLHVLLTAGPLGYLDAAGKPDHAKYRQLAARPVGERGSDVEARDALYWAAAKGYPLAVMSLALTLGGTVGDGNRERMLAALAKLPGHTNQALKNYEQVARHIERLGTSYTSPQLFLDSQVTQMVAGTVQTCGIRDPKSAERAPLAELVAVAISKPVSGAAYLPSKVAGNERAYLLAGEWEERWTYRGCGKTADVTVRFMADGLGGAFMTSAQKLQPGAAPATAL
ncbi:MAG: sel1 repeat family protein [Gammaproteobacteria bacterium]|nr:sel1 repeat family protein [Gammaproteobacteria bacterium]MBU1646025.1 sel1 repeat family protein [Gammaproteobacteria bacterium]MBU1972087.1 sel1 repeat family protein [Gammaproteobacteria bacterium]